MEMIVKRKYGRRLLALLLTACLVWALAPAAFAEDATITAKPASDSNKELKEALKDVKVYVDIYQVADVSMDNGGRFEFTFTEECRDLPLWVETQTPPADGEEEPRTELKEVLGGFGQIASDQKITSDTWSRLAQDAAALVRKESLTKKATLSVGKREAEEEEPEAANVNLGLYLLIAHTDERDYWKEIEGEDGAPNTLASIVHSDDKNFIYTPALVTVPYKDTVDGAVSTDTPGEWIYKVEAVLKPTAEDRLADLKITKTLSKAVGPEDAFFIFRIEATMGDGENKKTVYSDVKSITFSSAGTKELTLEKAIPIGAEVTVTEEYAGAHYQSAGQKTLTAIMAENGLILNGETLASAAFTNEWDETVTYGSGIVNHYTNNGSGWANPTNTDPDVIRDITDGGESN